LTSFLDLFQLGLARIVGVPNLIELIAKLFPRWPGSRGDPSLQRVELSIPLVQLLLHLLIVEALEGDIPEELGHAQQFARRIKELWGVVPGSAEFEARQSYLKPPEDQTDIVHVIRGVIEAEKFAIAFYNEILAFCAGLDPVTEDMVVGILSDEEGHLRLFEGFLREFASQRVPVSEGSAVPL
jgi:ferritin-like protein